MSITGCLRVKNESRWIERVIASVLPLCERVVVFDDHSTDTTPFLCASMPRVQVFDSPFSSFNEARDKNYLLDKVRKYSDWVLWIDGDELLEQKSVEPLLHLGRMPLYFDHGRNQCVSFRVHYLWNDEQTIRTDGVYGEFRRQSMFRPGTARFDETPTGPNFHCGNVPRVLWYRCAYPDVSLLHLGYMNREDRIRKYHWYNSVDPLNKREDCYKHMVVGDLFPASSAFKHGGPLVLQSRHAPPNPHMAP